MLFIQRNFIKVNVFVHMLGIESQVNEHLFHICIVVAFSLSEIQNKEKENEKKAEKIVLPLYTKCIRQRLTLSTKE